MLPKVNITFSIGSGFAWQNANCWQDADRRAAIIAAFWSRVQREKAKACWPFRGYIATHGYGYFHFTADGERQRERAHRFAWFIRHGNIPPGLEVCHSCDEPSCTNTLHLYLGTHQANHLDSVRKGRKRAWGLQKLNAGQVYEIRARVAAGELQYRVAKEFGIAKNTVSGIVRRKSWAHLAESKAS